MLSRIAALALALVLSASTAASAQPQPVPPELWRFSLAPPAQPPHQLRLRFLQLNLAALAKQDRARILEGSLQLALGAAFGVAAGFADDPTSRSLLALAGGLALARGSARLAVSTHARQHASEFAALPESSEASVRRKLQLGESALAHAAHQARRTRWIEGSLGMLGASALVPVSWGLSRREDASYRFGDRAFDYVGLSLSVIGFATSLVRTIVSSEPERQLRAYRELPP
jgi:hypothetical protein